MGNQWRRLMQLWRSRRMEAELAEEMDLHRQLKQSELEAQGVPRQDAADAARRAMGNTTLAREDSRAVWLLPSVESVWQDLAYGARTLRRLPGFAATAIGALALAIGLNTSLFTVYNAVALRPWPVYDPARIVAVYNLTTKTSSRSPASGFSVAQVSDLRAKSKALSGIIAMRDESVTVEGDPPRRPSRAVFVSANYFQVLGVGMELGRGFRADEDLPEAPQTVAVLSYPAWQSRFAADPSIIGKPLRSGKLQLKIVGVASRDFGGTGAGRQDFWIPMAALPLLRSEFQPGFLTSPGDCCVSVAGRLAQGVSKEQARAELDVLNRQFRALHDLKTDGILFTGTAFLANPGSKRKVGAAFNLMFAGVGLVLLLTCANVGNLLLARGAARQQEIAVRLSLGAGRRRVIRQLLTEALLLGGLAAIVGLVMACWLPGFVLSLAADEPLNLRLTPDWTVVFFAAVLSIAACVVFALAPALRITAWPAPNRIRQDAQRVPLRSILLAAQVAISVVLLTAAMLMIRGIGRAATADPGFTMTGVSMASVELPASYDAEESRTFARRLRGELDAVPAMRSIGFTRLAPLGNSVSSTGFRLPGDPQDQWKMTLYHEVSGSYFDVLRIPVRRGRNLETGDEGRRVVVVNEAFARRYFPQEPALGKVLICGNPTAPREIVGVVADAHTTALDRIEPTLYAPHPSSSTPMFLVRDAGGALIPQLKRSIEQIEPKASLLIQPLSENLEKSLAPARTGAALATTLGVVALFLSAIGTSGVFAFHVRQRTREIGIRMALGAAPVQAIVTVLAAGGKALAAGLLAGFGASLAVATVLRGSLYGLSPLDPVSYVAVAALLGAAALAATGHPARRAARIDPASALRYE